MSRWLPLLFLLLPVAVAGAPPRIVVTLPPLHSLVLGVSGGAAEVHLLVPAGASPHTFALAPSDARALSRADLVVAAAPNLERFLERPLTSLAAAAEVIWLIRVAGIHRLPARAGGNWSSHHDHAAAHADTHGSIDAHAWLDPRNAIAFTRALVEQLASLHPAGAATYRDNGRLQVQRLQALDRELAERIQPVVGVPYLVFHDAYQYFEHRYGLQPIGAVAVDPVRPPGAHRLAQLHDHIEQTHARCLFAEPQFEPKIVRVIRAATGVNTATLDPLGVSLAPGPGLYPRLMRTLADDLVECLVGASEARSRPRARSPTAALSE